MIDSLVQSFICDKEARSKQKISSLMRSCAAGAVIRSTLYECVCCVSPSHLFILDVRFVDVPAGVTHRRKLTQDCSSTFLLRCACLNFSREKDPAVPFPLVDREFL